MLDLALTDSRGGRSPPSPPDAINSTARSATSAGSAVGSTEKARSSSITSAGASSGRKWSLSTARPRTSSAHRWQTSSGSYERRGRAVLLADGANGHRIADLVDVFTSDIRFPGYVLCVSGFEQLPVPFGDYLKGAVDHFDGRLIVYCVRRDRDPGRPLFYVGQGSVRHVLAIEVRIEREIHQS
jgi:hypothetical protein